MRILVAIARTTSSGRTFEGDFRKQLDEALSFGIRNGAVTIKYIRASEAELRGNCTGESKWDILHLIAPVQTRGAANYTTIELESSTGSVRAVSSQFLRDLISATQIETIALYSLDPKSPFDGVAENVAARCDVNVIAVNEISARGLKTFLAKLHIGLNNPEVLAGLPGCMKGVRVWAATRAQATASPNDKASPPTDDKQAEREAEWKKAIALKQELGHFDVFLCHNERDKPWVRDIARQLKEAKILPWLDESELPPGMPWIPLLEEQIDSIGSAAVFFGSAGIGPWQQEELNGFLREFVRRKLPVVPVLLPDAPAEPGIPVFLAARSWVDFRSPASRPLDRLIWAITQTRPSDLP